MPSPRLLASASQDASRETSLADRGAKRLQRDQDVAAEPARDLAPFARLRAAGAGAGETVQAACLLELDAELGDAGDQQAPALVDETRAADGAQLEFGPAEEMDAEDHVGRLARFIAERREQPAADHELVAD